MSAILIPTSRSHTVTHRKVRNYDRINSKGYRSLDYSDPIRVANAAARRAMNVEVKLIKSEQRREVIQDIWDALAARDANRRKR